MKKLIFILISVIGSFGLIYSQSITVTNPAAGNTWYKGGLGHTIEWNKSGVQDANVKIRLFNSAGTIKILDITNSTPNDGTYPWSVPGMLANGDYVLRVKTLDNSVSDDSGIFSLEAIEVGPEEASLTVSSPHSGDQWSKGNSYNIRWSSTGTIGNVKIKLTNFNGTAIVLPIVNNTADDSSDNWSIPDSVVPGNYRIRVKTIDNSVSDDSDIFEIKESGIEIIDARNDRRLTTIFKKKIIVVHPSNTSKWNEGKIHKIIWKNAWTIGKKIKIDLYNHNGKKFIKNIYTRNFISHKSSFSDESGYSWKIPKGAATEQGYHKIRISGIDNNISGISERFHISRGMKEKKAILMQK